MRTINLRCRGAVAGFIFAIAAGVLCTPDLAATTVTSFTPTQGVAGTAVQITGQGFVAPSSVKFNGVNASFTVHGITSITAYVPATATTGPISVVDPFYGTGTSTTNFTIPAPIISSFAPLKVVPYTWINVKGTFLTGASAVTLNGVPPWSWYLYDDGNVWAQVPPTATSGPITITTPGGSGTSPTNYIRIPGLLANPTFDTDTAGWSTTYSITGAWDPLDADGSAGSGSMLFTHAANVYSAEGVVQCTRVSPNLQHRVGARYLIPAGQPLGSNNEVIVGVIWYSGTACDTGTFITSNSYDQQIYAPGMGTWQTATVAAMSPPTAQSAAVQGKLLTNVLLRAHLDNMFFDVDPPPSIVTLVPAMGVRGAEISLQGSGFYGVTGVQFNTTPASFTIRSANEIRAFVPAAAVDGPIHASAPAGVADSVNFDVILPPVITLSPNAARPGSTITISGNDLQHATSVTFNGVSASFVKYSGSLFVTVPATATTGLVTVTNPAGSGSASFATVLTPANVVATAISTTQVSITWDMAAGATSYQVFRRSNNGPFAVVGLPFTNSFLDEGLTPDTTYIYFVKAADGANVGFASNFDLATTTLFTDDPVVPASTIIKAVHVTELRTAVNAVRAAAGLPPATFTDAVTAGVVMKAVHISELRSNLDAARSTLALPAMSYTDPSLAAGDTIKAVHIGDLRSGVK